MSAFLEIYERVGIRKYGLSYTKLADGTVVRCVPFMVAEMEGIGGMAGNPGF